MKISFSNHTCFSRVLGSGVRASSLDHIFLQVVVTVVESGKYIAWWGIRFEYKSFRICTLWGRQTCRDPFCELRLRLTAKVGSPLSVDQRSQYLSVDIFAVRLLNVTEQGCHYFSMPVNLIKKDKFKTTIWYSFFEETFWKVLFFYETFGFSFN